MQEVRKLNHRPADLIVLNCRKHAGMHAPL